MVGPWIKSMIHTSLPNAWGRKVEKREKPLLDYFLQARKGEECMKHKYGLCCEIKSCMWKNNALMFHWNSQTKMLIKCSGKYACCINWCKEEEGMEENTWFHKPHLMSFLIVKIVYVYVYKRPLSPQAKYGSKTWEIVHFAGKLWQNFSRFVAENYSP